MVQLWRSFGGLVGPLAVVAAVVAVASVLVAVLRRGRGREAPGSFWNAVGTGLLVVWAAGIVLVTLKPSVWPPERGTAAELVPFGQIGQMLTDSVFWQVPLAQLGGNVALWVPGAVLAALRFGWRPWRCAWVTLVAAAAIELLQLLLPTGRVASTDDVLLAGVGGFVGGVAVGAVRLLRRTRAENGRARQAEGTLGDSL